MHSAFSDPATTGNPTNSSGVQQEHYGTSFHSTPPPDHLLQQRRVWKIGTYSMGLSLIGIGLAFAASLWQAVTSYELLLWLAPIIFIVLGLELIVAHSSKFSRKYKVEYNWLSVFFVGCVGAGALMLSALLSSGLLDEVNQIFQMKVRSVYVEESTKLVDPAIEKIVIKSELGYEIQKEAGSNEVALLGLLQYEAKDSVKLGEQQLLKTKQIGSVLYIFIQNLDYESNRLVNSYVHSQLVLSVPDNIEIK